MSMYDKSVGEIFGFFLVMVYYLPFQVDIICSRFKEGLIFLNINKNLSLTRLY